MNSKIENNKRAINKTVYILSSKTKGIITDVRDEETFIVLTEDGAIDVDIFDIRYID